VIPIVFAVAVGRLGSGLVAGLARPGGNVTGLSVQSADLADKGLEILRELLPNSADSRSWAMLAIARRTGDGGSSGSGPYARHQYQ
jgi:ABC transporter substrate binding protein